jgi:nitroreductase
VLQGQKPALPKSVSRISAGVRQQGAMMDVREAISQRYSVRHYEDRPVDEDKLMRVLGAARLAPSASNRQEWRFVVVRDRARREALAQAARSQAFVGEAPVVIVACAVDTERIMSCGLPSFSIDVAIALEHIALQATEEGLGTCWIGAFDADKVKELLEIPEDARVVQLMPLGYPADEPKPKVRKEMHEIVMREKWGANW